MLILSFSHHSFVRGVSFDFVEDSFRKVFEAFGKIKTIFMVRSPSGKIEGYGYPTCFLLSL